MPGSIGQQADADRPLADPSAGRWQGGRDAERPFGSDRSDQQDRGYRSECGRRISHRRGRGGVMNMHYLQLYALELYRSNSY